MRSSVDSEWPWIHPLLWNLAAAWGPVEIMFLAMLNHMQASPLRKARKFAELSSSISLPHHLRQREKDLKGSIPILFLFLRGK